MLQRLVISLTALLGLTGAVVVAGYLLIFAAGTDRAAAAVPADTTAYVTVYLQPTTGQQMNLAALMGHIPGFADAAGLDQKIHEISARFLGQAGIEYEADVRPWIGNQVSIALAPGATLVDPPRWLLLAGVKDPEQASAALNRIIAGRGLTGSPSNYQGDAITVADGMAWAVLQDLVLVAPDLATLESALDARAGRRASLADDTRYSAAMRRLPPDYLAAAYVDVARLAHAADIGDQIGGYSTLSAALMAEPQGLRLQAIAPFDATAASLSEREGFALSTEPSSLAEWMPADSQAAGVVFGLRRTVEAAETDIAGQPGTQEITDALNQLRALAAFGLGIDLNEDLLPLFDAESGLAVSGVNTTAFRGQLILRPSDADAASASLQRMRDALQAHGAQLSERDAAGITITTVDIPQVASLSWAISDGVIVGGRSFDDVEAALAARSSGNSLAEAERYRAAWELAGSRGGNEAFVDIGSLADSQADGLGITGDTRDILLSIAALGMTAPAVDDASEIHMVVTVR